MRMPDREATRKRLSPAERKQRLLAAAVEHFGERGYGDASLREIAAAAGVTTPVLYDHFRSKAELYAAVAWQQADSLLARWSQPIEGSDEEVFRGTIERIFAWIEANPQGSRILFADPPSDPFVAEAITAVLERAVGAVAELFAAPPALELPAGLERERANAALAKLSMSAVDGLAAWWWHNQDVPRATVVSLACDVLWRGLDQISNNQEERSDE